MGANVVYMQDLLPEQKGAASSLGMGISWGVASLMLSALSAFVNRIGLLTSMVIVSTFGFVAFVMSLYLILPAKNPDK